MTVLLCSSSPRRQEFLQRLGVRFTVLEAHIDEAQLPSEDPRRYALRMAQEKAARGTGSGNVVLAADTVVVVRGEVLQKPRDRVDARRMLGLLGGTTHLVMTAVCVPPEAEIVETRVRFQPLTDAQIAWLAASGDGDDKAGAYALQGLAGAFIESVEGSVSNVVGLPLAETLRMLGRAGVALPWA
jgi:septum formation protein